MTLTTDQLIQAGVTKAIVYVVGYTKHCFKKVDLKMLSESLSNITPQYEKTLKIKPLDMTKQNAIVPQAGDKE